MWPAGHAQIGKGMWAMPDLMEGDAGAEDRPSEGRRQHRLGALADGCDAARAALSQGQREGPPGELASRPEGKAGGHPVDPGGHPSELVARGHPAELDNNAQGILGYVVRWVDQGVGCSKVPDITMSA
jgi:malate synthase